jgi:hypothetical protein
MTPQQLLGLGLRISSIWLVLLAFQLLVMANATFSVTFQEITPLWLGLSLLPCIPGIFLWFFPMLVAHKLVPQRQATGENDSILDVTAALAVFVGMLAVIKSLPFVFGGLCMITVGADSPVVGDYFAGEFGTKFSAGIAQYCVGFILIFMPRFVAKLIFRAPARVTPSI